MKAKYIVVEINKSDFLAVTKAQRKLDFNTRPVGYYSHLMPEMKAIAESICDISKFNNPYLLEVV